MITLVDGAAAITDNQTDATFGLSIARDGSFAPWQPRGRHRLHAVIDGKNVAVSQTVTVCGGEDRVSDVAISPTAYGRGERELRRYLAVLTIKDGRLALTGRKFRVRPAYRCVISPDGDTALTAGSEGFATA